MEAGDQHIRRGILAAAMAVAATLLVAPGCGGSKAAPAAPGGVVSAPSPEPARSRVVIVSVDGLRPDAIAMANTPAITALAARGAYTWTAQTIMPSTTLPSHASMLSGFTPSAHGITWNDYDASRGPIPVPTVFTVARAAGLRTVLIAGKEKFRQLDQPGTIAQMEFCASYDDEVGNRAVGVALSGAFDLMFVHLPQTDLTGHDKGWLSRPYLAAVEGADRVVGQLLAALPEGTTVILTADHGGHGTTHGVAMPSDLNIPWIVAGPRVAPRALGRVSTTDTAVTALWLLGLKPGAGASGRVVAEAFAPAPAAVAVAAP